jgi:hypothetical protein
MVIGKTRNDAKTVLMNFWTKTTFVGTLTIGEANTAEYDDSVDNLISAVSNQSSNRFDTSGSGDGQGTMIDIPDTDSAKKKVAKYAQKLLLGLGAVKDDLGNIGKDVRKQLREFCETYSE